MATNGGHRHDKVAPGTARVEAEDESSAAELIIEEIRRRLRKGQLVPGQRIVGSELANEMGCSRIPVREAIHRLTGEGLIELDRNRSPRIRSVTPQDLRDMLYLLGALVSLALKLAARHEANNQHEAESKAPASRETSRLAKVFDDIVRAAEDRDAFMFNDTVHLFHRELTEVVGNRYLRNAFSSLHSEYFSRDLAPRLRRRHWLGMASNYRLIKKLYLSGDGEGASRAFNEHMEWVIAELFPEDASGGAA